MEIIRTKNVVFSSFMILETLLDDEISFEEHQSFHVFMWCVKKCFQVSKIWQKANTRKYFLF